MPRISKYVYRCTADKCHWDNQNHKGEPCGYRDNCVYRKKEEA